jgi:predicted nucleic acid-binding protein
MRQYQKLKAIYLDVCALGRPYDNQNYPRIQIEKAAVDVIVTFIKNGIYDLYYSPVHGIEIAENPDVITRTEINELFQEYGKNIASVIKDKIVGARAIELFSCGFGPSDAFHVAYAQEIGASFVTCDDLLLRKCTQAGLNIWSGSPVDFCRKEGLI